MSKDYYETLGINKDATKEEIKKAYKKLAKKYHPDINKAEDAESKFKEINEAVSVLADEQKRQRYDQYGSADENSQGGFGDFSRGFDFSGGSGFESIFEQFFGGGSRRQQPRRGPDLVQEVELTLEQVATGTTKKINVNKLSRCKTCTGTGGELETCDTCKGTGILTRTRRTPFGLFQTQANCSTCNGLGQQIKVACKTCHGEGRVRERKDLEVEIPAGIDEGTRLRVRGEGVMPEHGEPGDLFLIVNIKEHAIFKRDHGNILLEVPLSFTQAVLGDEIDVPILNGKATLKIPKNTQNDTIFRMRGKGVPDGHGTGDQLVRVNIKVPEKLTKKQLDLIKELSKLEKEKPTSFFKKFF